VNLAARTVVGAGAGLVTEAGDRAEFLDAAAALATDLDLRTRSAAAGRRYAETHFDIGAITRRFEGVFLQAAERREAAAARRVRAA
jgi:glycosyltransferase involved in cell wall biosynthesis